MKTPQTTSIEKLVPAATRISARTLDQVQAVADAREWSTAQTLRKLIERGLEAMKAEQPATPRAHERAKAA